MKLRQSSISKASEYPAFRNSEVPKFSNSVELKFNETDIPNSEISNFRVSRHSEILELLIKLLSTCTCINRTPIFEELKENKYRFFLIAFIA